MVATILKNKSGAPSGVGRDGRTSVSAYRLGSLEGRLGRAEEIVAATNLLSRSTQQTVELVLRPAMRTLVQMQGEIRDLQDARLRAESSLHTLRLILVAGGATATMVISWLAVR